MIFSACCVPEGKKPEDYRPNVGIALFSRSGLVMVGRRRDISVGVWQMPQGGIDEGETPEQAVLRELQEETGLESGDVRQLSVLEGWLYYDFPHEVRERLNSPFLGQRQKWFAFRLTAPEHRINLETDQPEFGAWRWVCLEETLSLAADFKRKVYACVVRCFSGWSAAAISGGESEFGA